MPLTKEMIAALPHTTGVYLYLNSEGKEIYVGKAKDLRKRVSSYNSIAKKDIKTKNLVADICDLKFIETSDEVEALIVEARLIRELQPHYNIALKNTDFYPFLEITLGNDFPLVQITRAPANKKSRFIGPFTDVGALRLALKAVQPIFKFISCGKVIEDDPEKLRYNRPCLNYNMGLCSAPCSGRISKLEYRKKIKALILFFSGKKARLISLIKKQMEIAAHEFRFEEAGQLRDQMLALQKLAKPSEMQRKAVMFVDIRPQDALKQLKKALSLESEPTRIEGYDISNLGDESAVGSLVCFVNGIPYKQEYRRYKIKTVPGQNDFAMLAEVLKRRLVRLKYSDDEVPSLIVIDGGQGQINTVHKVMEEVGFVIPAIGLAKQFEHIHFPDGRKPVKLAKGSAGLKLIAQIRDESHRFAQQYHHLLRAKKIFGTHYTPPKKKKRRSSKKSTEQPDKE